MKDKRAKALNALELSRAQLRLALHQKQLESASGPTSAIMPALVSIAWRAIMGLGGSAATSLVTGALMLLPQAISHLRRWGRSHPWVLVGSGFSLGALVVLQRKHIMRMSISLLSSQAKHHLKNHGKVAPDAR